jgi:hypothetical protein
MLFASWLRASLSPRRVAAWATEVAQHCQADVAARLGPAFHMMSLSEAKGYIRARTAAVLDQQIMLLADPIGNNPELQLAVRRQATDEIVRMTLGDLLKASRRQVVRKAA